MQNNTSIDPASTRAALPTAGGEDTAHLIGSAINNEISGDMTDEQLKAWISSHRLACRGKGGSNSEIDDQSFAMTLARERRDELAVAAEVDSYFDPEVRAEIDISRAEWVTLHRAERESAREQWKDQQLEAQLEADADIIGEMKADRQEAMEMTDPDELEREMTRADDS